MKKVFAALAFVAIAASPAMAQEVIESGLPTHLSNVSTFNATGMHAYASSPRGATHSVAQTGAAFDPDPNVRLQLQNQADINDR
jgi:hypothetical protein